MKYTPIRDRLLQGRLCVEWSRGEFKRLNALLCKKSVAEDEESQ